MKWRCQHGFPSFKQEKVRRGAGIYSAGSCPGADVASVGSVLSLGLLSGATVGLEWKNIKKVPVQLTVYTAKIADMGLY